MKAIWRMYWADFRRMGPENVDFQLVEHKQEDLQGFFCLSSKTHTMKSIQTKF